MKFLEALIAWTPITDDVDVGPWPDHTGWSDRYMCTDGACYSNYHKMTPVGQERMLFIIYNMLTAGDHVPPAAAHKAFLKIDEYRRSISPDMPGAEGGDVWG
jgi:hypothetical protein